MPKYALLPVQTIELEKYIFKTDKEPTQTCESWAEAEETLQQWAFYAPEDEKKPDALRFVITWEDGRKYTGKFRISKKCMNQEANLAAHVYEYLTVGASQGNETAYELLHFYELGGVNE